jgi:hypothetical protein
MHGARAQFCEPVRFFCPRRERCSAVILGTLKGKLPDLDFTAELVSDCQTGPSASLSRVASTMLSEHFSLKYSSVK